MARTGWEQLVERYAEGRPICNCKQAYSADGMTCRSGCSANQIDAKEEIGRRVIAEQLLTPAQQHADKLLEAARDVLQQRRDGVTPLELGFLRGAVELVDPPAPVTLREAIEVIRALVGPAKGWSSTADEAARELLARVPGERDA